MNQSTVYVCSEENRGSLVTESGCVHDDLKVFSSWEPVRKWVLDKCVQGQKDRFVIDKEDEGDIESLIAAPGDVSITMFYERQELWDVSYDITVRKMSVERPTTQEKFLMTLPVGDFSMDGHEGCTELLVRSDKPFQDVREAHFRIKEATGVDIHGFANEYGDDTIPGNVLERLHTLGFKFTAPPLEDGKGTHLASQGNSFGGAEVMADIWVFLLNQADPGLHLCIADNPPVPSLLFSGPDDKGRLSHSVGYGCFS